MKKILISIAAVLALIPLNVFAFSENQEAVVSGECSTIRQTLQTVQKVDSKVRTHLGSYYEKVLNKYMIPLNSRLVENNMPNNDLFQTQTNFNDKKKEFSNDYIEYQKNLEELINIDCKNSPNDFLEKLTTTRDSRKKVHEDIGSLKALVNKYKELVNSLMETL